MVVPLILAPILLVKRDIPGAPEWSERIFWETDIRSSILAFLEGEGARSYTTSRNSSAMLSFRISEPLTWRF